MVYHASGNEFDAPLPRTERPTVERRRLLDQLRGRWSYRVTVVDAPAGYGKTTLLTQAIDANNVSPLGVDCWLACAADPAGGHVSATVFGAGLCAAVGVPSPQIGHATGDLVDDVVAKVCEAVWRRSPDHVALVLDDVHEIPPASDAALLLARLVETLPVNGHLVLAGRNPPPVPLARLEAQGKVAWLDETDLAFSGDELAEFAELRTVPLSRLAAAGGWPALAELSASAGSGTSMSSCAGPSSRLPTEMADYLGHVVLAPLDATRRRHLALLADLGSFDNDLARAALDEAVDVDELMAGMPLVTAVDRGVRTLHPLLRSVLKGQVDPADLAASRLRTARLLTQRGAPEKAVPRLIDAAAWDHLGDALVVLLGAAHAVVPRDVLAEWCERLPATAQTGPYGQLLAAALAVEGAPEDAWERLQRCAETFRAAGSMSGEAACLAQLARLAWWSDEPERLAVLAVRMEALEAAGCEAAAALACLGRALILDLQNDCAGVLAEIDRVPPGSLSQAWQGVARWLRSSAFLQLGDTDSALAAAHAALRITGDLHAPLAEGTRLQALWYGGRITEALDAVPALLERLEAVGHRGHIAVGAAQCSVAYSLGGDQERASTLLARARASVATTDAPLVDTNLAIAAAALAVATGDEVSARRTLATCLDRHPLREGLPAGAHLRNLALIYVLVPETRAAWDQAELGPAFIDARNVARAIVAVRDQRRVSAGTPPLPPAGVVQAHVPLPWIAELGVAAVEARRADGWRLLEDTWPDSRPAVVHAADATGDHLGAAAREVLTQLPVPPSAHYRLRLLGPIELLRDGTVVDDRDWGRGRVRALLAHLVLHGTVLRERLAEELWPDRAWTAQSANLRPTLAHLLRVLEPDRGSRDASFFVRQHGANFTLHPGKWLDVDVWEFDAVCRQAVAADERGEPSVALDRGLRAVELWVDQPHELAAEPWAHSAIERWKMQYTAAVTRAGELLVGLGDTKRALALTEQVLEANPWSERAHRLAVAAYDADGDELAAEQASARYRRARDEIGADGEDTTHLLDRLRARSNPE